MAPLEKEAARPKVVDAIKNLAWDDRVLCVRVNAWDTEWTYGDVIEVVGNSRRAARRDHAAQGAVGGRGAGARSVADPGREEVGAAGRARRDRSPDRDGPWADQRGRDLRRLAPARDDHLRPGRLRRQHRDARPHRGHRHPRVPRRPFQLRLQPHFDGRAGQRAPGHRRTVSQGARARRPARVLAAHAHARLRRQVGAHSGPGDRAQRGVLADPGAVRPGLRHPRGLPQGHRRGPHGCGHVRRRDDRRGEPQDRPQVRQPGRTGRTEQEQRPSRSGGGR